MTPTAPPLSLPVDSTAMVEAAVLYASANLPPIPVYGVREGGACMCGRSDCHAAGKHPKGTKWQKHASIDVDEVRERFRDHYGNVGIYLGMTGLVLLDADGEVGLQTAVDWNLPETLTQQSGSGSGAHYIYRLAANHDASTITDRSKIAPGLDVKVRGQFVAAPSRHPSGGRYRWLRVMTPTILPDWLYERIKRQSPPSSPSIRALATSRATASLSLSARPGVLEARADAYMAKIPPAIAGARGHDQAFAAARALVGWVRKGLPESYALKLLSEYSARCEPPWSEQELAHKWASAQNAQRIPEIADRPRLPPVGSASAASSQPFDAQSFDPLTGEVFEPPRERAIDAPGEHDEHGAAPLAHVDSAATLLQAPTPAPSPASRTPGAQVNGHGALQAIAWDAGGASGAGGGGPSGGIDWRSALRWTNTRSGEQRLLTDVDNLVRILQLDPRWAGKITFDVFQCKMRVSPDLPWDEFTRPTEPQPFWTDEDAVRMSAWMHRDWHGRRFEPTKSDCEQAAMIVARNHDVHPLRDYLSSLEWDGTPRLCSWLARYLGAEDAEYTRMVGPWWLISAVARIMAPGCKVDTVPILEGKQGARKSTALKILAGAENFNDTPIDLNSKDAYTAIQGSWFVELAELDSLMRATSSRAKAFFSSPVDKFRKPYARNESQLRRQCIFVGTVNLDDYLTDPTGARRFWPIRCGHIDIDALAADRDQLWAEAVGEYWQGRTWYPESESDAALLAERQGRRTFEDAWVEQIASWLGRTRPVRVTTGQLLGTALGIEQRDWSHSAQTRVGIIMGSKLGWSKRRVSEDGGRSWVYEPPYEPPPMVGQTKFEGGQPNAE